ncbi:hypothetical protein ABZP36_017965 [Zizania latifolia]
MLVDLLGFLVLDLYSAGAAAPAPGRAWVAWGRTAHKDQATGQIFEIVVSGRSVGVIIHRANIPSLLVNLSRSCVTGIGTISKRTLAGIYKRSETDPTQADMLKKKSSHKRYAKRENFGYSIRLATGIAQFVLSRFFYLIVLQKKKDSGFPLSVVIHQL